MSRQFPVENIFKICGPVGNGISSTLRPSRHVIRSHLFFTYVGGLTKPPKPPRSVPRHSHKAKINVFKQLYYEFLLPYCSYALNKSPSGGM